MSHFMIVLIPYVNLLNLSWIKKNVYKCLFLRNMKPLKFTEGINSKVRIADSNLGLFKDIYYLDKDIFLNLCKPFARPHLEYASSVWSPVYKKIQSR